MLDPYAAIFLIFRDGKLKDSRCLLGTGFFVNQEGEFLTAGHVFGGAPLRDGEGYFAVRRHKDNKKYSVHKISDAKQSSQYDIASGKVTDWPEVNSFDISDNFSSPDVDVICSEYSRSYIKNPTGDSPVAWVALTTHKGNITRFYKTTDDDPRFKLPTDVMSTSFPALKGASGAPVIDTNSSQVVALLVGNYLEDLQPIEEEKSSDGKEERRYYVPSGLCISYVHLNEYMKEKGISP